MPAPVIMVHGAFCAGWVFEAFKAPFEAAGHRCLTPDLPGHAPGAPHDATAGLSMTDYAAAVAALVDASDEPPLLIGHSLGGLVALMAAARSTVGGLIMLAPSSPWGIASNAMEDAPAAFGMMGISAYWGQAVDPDSGVFGAYSVDRMAPAKAEALFARLSPESGRALSEAINWWLDPFMTTSVTPSQIAAPVLVAAGGLDRIHSAGVVRQTAERYGAQMTVFPQMSHWLIGEPGWDDVAAACLDWIDGALKAAA